MPKPMRAETAIRLFGAPEFFSMPHVERYGFCFAARSLTMRREALKTETAWKFFLDGRNNVVSA
jgi:hypothetical protein